MKLPVFKSCCCGCSLRTGTLIIGYIGVIACITLAVSAAFGLVNWSTYGAFIDRSWRSYYIAMLVISLILYVIQFFVHSTLVIGAHEGNVRSLRMFVVWATVLLCIAPVGCVLNVTICGIAHGVPDLLGILLQGYFILIVRSFQLELESSPGQDNMNFRGPKGRQPDYPIQQPAYLAQPGFPAPPDYQANPAFVKTGNETTRNEQLPPTAPKETELYIGKVTNCNS